MKKKLHIHIVHRQHPEFHCIELGYSSFMWLSGNSPWFCRIWNRHWVKKPGNLSYGQAYGKSKFDAYRKALKDLKSKPGYKIWEDYEPYT